MSGSSNKAGVIAGLTRAYVPCLDLGFFTLSSSPHATLGALSGICFCCWLRAALLLLLVLGLGKAAEIPPSASLLVSPHLCLSFSSQGSNTRCFPLSASSRCVLPGPEPSSSKEEAPFFFSPLQLCLVPGCWLALKSTTARRWATRVWAGVLVLCTVGEPSLKMQVVVCALGSA